MGAKTCWEEWGWRGGEEKEPGFSQPEMTFSEDEQTWGWLAPCGHTPEDGLSRQLYIAISESGNELFRKLSAV